MCRCRILDPLLLPCARELELELGAACACAYACLFATGKSANCCDVTHVASCGTLQRETSPGHDAHGNGAWPCAGLCAVRAHETRHTRPRLQTRD